jgi:1-acyl-sn-glycerol-3-phosphate acyltransferase
VSIRGAIRRGISVPVVVALEAILLLSSPLSMAVAAVACLLTRSSRPLRTTALVIAYAAIELDTLSRIMRGVDDWDALVRRVLVASYAAMRRSLAVPLVIETGSPGPDEVGRTNAVIALSRHCGPGDSVYIAWLLGIHYGLSLHIVLKGALRWEPTINLAAGQVPLCFVGSRPEQAVAEVGELAAGLTAGDALLLFPEGRNFSWARWHAAIAHLRRQGQFSRAQRAGRRTHTLPPRLGGAVAALAAAPTADVLLIAHSGFSDDGRDRPWWRLPVKRDLVVRTVLIPASRVPRDEAGVSEFLDHAWAQVDTWVEGHAHLLELDVGAGVIRPSGSDEPQ